MVSITQVFSVVSLAAPWIAPGLVIIAGVGVVVSMAVAAAYLFRGR